MSNDVLQKNQIIIVIDAQSHEPIALTAEVYSDKVVLPDGRQIMFPVQDYAAGDIVWAYYDGSQVTPVPRKAVYASPMASAEIIVGDLSRWLQKIEDFRKQLLEGKVTEVLDVITHAPHGAYPVMLTKADLYFDVEFPTQKVHAYLDCGSSIVCIDTEVAAELKIKPSGTIVIDGATGLEAVPKAFVNFSVNGEKFEHEKAAIIPLKSKGYTMLLSDKFLKFIAGHQVKKGGSPNGN